MKELNPNRLIWIKSINLDGYLKELNSAGFTITWTYVDSQYRFNLQYKSKDIFFIDTGKKLQKEALVVGRDACKNKEEDLCEQYDIQLTMLENE